MLTTLLIELTPIKMIAGLKAIFLFIWTLGEQKITILHSGIQCTHPLLSSCSEVTVHRALLPVSHGTRSRALWTMGGGERGSGWLPGSHMSREEVSERLVEPVRERQGQWCHHTGRKFIVRCTARTFCDGFYPNTKITEHRLTADRNEMFLWLAVSCCQDRKLKRHLLTSRRRRNWTKLTPNDSYFVFIQVLVIN